MYSSVAPIEKPQSDLTLDEAIARARQNQHRFWVIFMLWVAAAVVAMGMFYKVAREVDQVRKDLDRSLQANRDTTEKLKGDMDLISKRRDEIKRDIDLKVGELEKTISKSQDELKRFNEEKQQRIEALNDVLSKAKSDIDDEKRALLDLRNHEEKQQNALGELTEKTTALQGDLKKALEQIAVQMGEFKTKVSTLEEKAAATAKMNMEFKAINGNTRSRQLASEAVTLLKAGNEVEAISKLDQAIEATDDNDFKAVALGLRAMAKNNIGLANSALIDVTEALKERPNNVEFLELRAQIFHDLDRVDEAKADLETGLRIEPGNVGLLQQLGHLYLKHYDTPTSIAQAIAAYTQALKAKPDNLNVLGERGLAYTLAGKFGEAAQDLARTLEMCGTDNFARARTLESQALLALGHGDLAESLDIALKAEALQPKRLWTSFILAASLHYASSATLTARHLTPADSGDYVKALRERAAKSTADAYNLKYLRRFLPKKYQQFLDESIKPIDSH